MDGEVDHLMVDVGIALSISISISIFIIVFVRYIWRSILIWYVISVL